MKPIAPKAASEEIQDSSSVVIFPEAKGVASDLKSSKLGPVNPITIPNMKAVRFTRMMNEYSNLLHFTD